jgi:hypothetical protein
MHGLERMPLFRAVALVLAASVLLVHAAHAQGANPSAVVSRYEDAWGDRNINAALNEFADDAVITLHDARTRTLSGSYQIREFLEAASLGAAPALTTAPHVDGTTVTWSERTEANGQVLSSAELTVQAVVEGGKIRSLVYRPGTLARGPSSAATEMTPESAATALAALVLFGLGLLSLATAGRPMGSGSHLRGRLVRHLHGWRPRVGQPSWTRAGSGD